MGKQDVDFFDLLKESLESLDDYNSDNSEFISEADAYETFLDLSQEELDELSEEMQIDSEEMESIAESIYRSVDSAGNIKKKLTRKVRSRRATATTGISRSERKRRARKAVMTKKRNPAILRKAMKKRNKALRKRRNLRLS